MTSGQWRSGMPIFDHLYTASAEIEPSAAADAAAMAAGPPAALMISEMDRMNLDILEFNSRYKRSEFRTENNSSSYAAGMEWNERLKGLLDEKSWSIPKLAAQMGHAGDQTMIDRLYKYTPREGRPVVAPRGTLMADMARALGVTEEFLRFGRESAGDLPPPNATIGGPIRQSRGRTPVLGHAVGGDDGKFVLNGQTVADILTPGSLEGVADAYAVFVHDVSMSPRYEPGEVLHVHPHKGVRQGDYVVVQVQDGEEIAGFVKRFVSRSDKEVVVEQLNPARKIRFQRQKVIHIHKIVGSGEG